MSNGDLRMSTWQWQLFPWQFTQLYCMKKVSWMCVTAFEIGKPHRFVWHAFAHRKEKMTFCRCDRFGGNGCKIRSLCRSSLSYSMQKTRFSCAIAIWKCCQANVLSCNCRAVQRRIKWQTSWRSRERVRVFRSFRCHLIPSTFSCKLFVRFAFGLDFEIGVEFSAFAGCDKIRRCVKSTRLSPFYLTIVRVPCSEVCLVTETQQPRRLHFVRLIGFCISVDIVTVPVSLPSRVWVCVSVCRCDRIVFSCLVENDTFRTKCETVDTAQELNKMRKKSFAEFIRYVDSLLGKCVGHRRSTQP